jgi:hypothetical protein
MAQRPEHLVVLLERLAEARPVDLNKVLEAVQLYIEVLYPLPAREAENTPL